ncbi:MAG: hypothetical protein J1E62_01840 [Lachnospiraceae bacterium]|nr:hypothetical protein [Lachnospiraceae bacterium]
MRILKRVGIGIGVAALVLIAVYFIFHIDKVAVEGTEYYTESEIKNEVFRRKLSRNGVVLWVYEKTVGLESLPFVETIDVEYHGPRSITLRVYDKTISGCIKYMGQYVYFDKDGIVLQTIPEQKEGIPVVTGIDFGTFTVGEAFQVEDDDVFRSIMNLSQSIVHYEIPAEQIHVNAGTLTLYSGDLKIYLGKKKMYDDELSNLSKVFEKAKEKKLSLKGEIHMENFKNGDSIIIDAPKKTKNSGEKNDMDEENS